jgi:hypothetical protein
MHRHHFLNILGKLDQGLYTRSIGASQLHLDINLVHDRLSVSELHPSLKIIEIASLS